MEICREESLKGKALGGYIKEHIEKKIAVQADKENFKARESLQ
jgi:hypothetical protein